MNETTENKDKTKKPLTLARPGRLELKKTVEQGQIRQSFSHGRSKAVTVEVRKKRTYAQTAGGEMTEVGAADAARQAFSPAKSPEPAQSPSRGAAPATPSDDNLTEAERKVRARVLEQARLDEERRRKEEEERARLEAEQAAERARLEAEEAARRAAEPPAPEAAPEEAAMASEPARPAAEAAAPRPAVTPKPAAAAEEEDEAVRARKGVKVEKPKKTLTPVKGDTKRRGKLTITRALDDEAGERVRSLASVRRARERERRAQAALRRSGESAKIYREVVIPETITVQELSNRMAERGAEVVKTLMKLGVMATITQTIDADTAELVANEFGHHVKRVSESDVEEGMIGAPDLAADLAPRPPVVTVMGHVDHGKTSLLDALRKTDIAARESGGITQHIGAYQVTMPSGQKITFLDTPGHEAFTQMRARGARVTDIVVLVVAADDGVMPQTVEAIRHAHAAGVPIIVAINKIDLPGADPERIKNDLLRHDVALEGYGGDVLWVEVSAKQGTHLDKLEETILLQAELLELKANPDRAAEGVIVEAKMEQGRGNVATVLVSRGTLRVGDVFVAGAEWGRVRALVDDHGRNVQLAGPAMPVEVLGLQGSPVAGDDFAVVDGESRARQVAEYRTRRARSTAAAGGGRGSVEQMLASIAAGEAKEFPVIVKADVQGSVEAIVGALEKMGTEEVRAQILHAAVGGINESDITLARASKALVIGFNVRANPQARDLARRDGVEIRYYSIIYDVTDDVRQALTGMLAPDTRETRLGEAEVKQVFNVTKVGRIAGCVVSDGIVRRGARVRLLRDSVVVHEGELSSLRHFKDEVKEVRSGSECGIGFANYNDVQVGDVIECFEVEQVARTL